ncbi:glycosyltransferase [Mammaliicoccus sp. H-M32]|uniref:glycosyltransferase n=1 Tax=Mammaliicoccus sp. H-M32 TaxID=2898691 RepID=UPI001EFB0A28
MISIKNILFIHHYGGYGGAGISLINNIEMLKDDYRITVILPSYPDDMRNELLRLNIKVIEFNDVIGTVPIYSGGSDFWKPSMYKSIFKIFGFNKFLNKIIKTGNYDFLLVNSITLFWVGFKKNIQFEKLGCFVRETRDKKKKISNILIKKILNKYFSKIFFISEFDKNTYEDRRSKSKYYLINDCMKKVTFIKSKNKNSLNLLFLGGYQKIKGLDILLKALNYLNNKDIKLSIAGDTEIKSSYANKIQKSINTLNKKGMNIKVIGTVKNASDMYNDTDILIFPSRKPHQSRPLFEAGFYKIPVIITENEIVNERIENGFNGFKFEARNFKSLSRKIKLFIKNPNLVNKLGENNYELSLKNHNFEDVKINLLKAIEE